MQCRHGTIVRSGGVLSCGDGLATHIDVQTTPSRRLGGRSALGQSLVEFALVTPILLLVFAGAADFGRAFYAYVAIENAAKEGALYGARAPLCDNTSPGSCTDPNNVVWRVQNELKDQGIRNPDGTQLVPTVTCTPATPPEPSRIPTCEAARRATSTRSQLVYPFKLLTPILSSITGDVNLRSSSTAIVLNLAFDPSPGASVNKFVLPGVAVNAGDVDAQVPRA